MRGPEATSGAPRLLHSTVFSVALTPVAVVAFRPAPAQYAGAGLSGVGVAVAPAGLSGPRADSSSEPQPAAPAISAARAATAAMLRRPGTPWCTPRGWRGFSEARPATP